MVASGLEEQPKHGSGSSVYELIHSLHEAVKSSIDTALSWEDLNSPPVNYTVVRPLVKRFSPDGLHGQGKGEHDGAKSGIRGPSGPSASSSSPGKKGNGFLRPDDRGESGRAGGSGQSAQQEEGITLGAVLYALMANRIQFFTLSAGDLSYAPLQSSRAAFCELLAMKIIREYPHPDDEAALVTELVRGWCAFDGASQEVWDSMGDDRDDVEEMRGSALELAIVSTSKHFLALPLVQQLITQIYTGHLMYIPFSTRSLISDSYVSERTRERSRTARRRASSVHSNSPAPLNRASGDSAFSPMSRTSRRPSRASASGGRAGTRRGSTNTQESAIEFEDAQVFVYDPYEAGWLDHQRLRVPRWRNMMEFFQFVIMLALFMATLSARDVYRTTLPEMAFVLFSVGFVLDEFAASKEHGFTVYAANAWNAVDMTYISIFALYLALRIFALVTHSPETSDLAFDILATCACILFPRLVFFLIRDNVVVLALRAMLAQYLNFMGLSFLAFSGITFCLWTLGRGTWTIKQIVWLMLQIWFGSSYLGFTASQSFHPIFGPLILISFAALSNTLLITMLISLLSNKFGEINANAQMEHLFQRAVKTVEGSKSDAVFSYFPPFNILALLLLTPLSWVCSPRTLHRINVFCIRITSFPLLIAISLFERRAYKKAQAAVKLSDGPLTKVKETFQKPGLLDSFLGGGLEMVVHSVFEAAPPASVKAEAAQAKDRSSGAKASKARATSSSDSDEDSSANDQTHDARQSNGQSTRRVPDSPLAKLYGGSGSASKSAKRNKARKERRATAQREDTEHGAHADGTRSKAADEDQNEEVRGLQKELQDVRESQLRMEELLNQLLAGGGDK